MNAGILYVESGKILSIYSKKYGYSLPFGKAEASDEDIRFTAFREAIEETRMIFKLSMQPIFVKDNNYCFLAERCLGYYDWSVPSEGTIHFVDWKTLTDSSNHFSEWLKELKEIYERL